MSMRAWRCALRKIVRIFLGVTLLALLLTRPLAASANGNSLTLYLGYVPSVSNWGPAEARGEAVVNIGEGTIELKASGLPAFAEQVYEVWLVTASMGSWVSMGRFGAATDGSVAYAAAVDSVPVEDYRYLVITVEPTADDSREPSGQNSIAAVFPNSDIAVTDSSGVAVTAASAGGMTPPPPAYLPETGAASGTTGQAAVPVLLALALTAGVVWRGRR